MNKRNIILVLVLLAVLLGFATLNGYLLQKRLALEHAHEGIVDILKRARKLTIEQGESHLVVMEDSRAFLYKVANKNIQIKSVDLTKEDGIRIISMDLVTGGNEVIFSGSHGTTENHGRLRIAFVNNQDKFKDVFVSPSGEIDLPEEEREERIDEALTDWRDRCHADRINLRFSEAIAGEGSLALDFGGEKTLLVDVEYIIQEDIWRGIITVSGEDQLIALGKGESQNQLVLIRPDNLVNQPFGIIFEGDEVASVNENGVVTTRGNVLCKSQPTSLEEQLQ